MVRQPREQPQVTFQRDTGGQQAQVAQQGQVQQGQAEQGQAQLQTQQRQIQQQSGASPATAARVVSVSRLLEMSVYDSSGQLLGDMERVIRNSRGELAVVIGHGGLLGMTEESLDNMPARSEPAGTVDVPENQAVHLTASDA